MGIGLYRLNLGGISVLGEDQLAFALLQSLNWGGELSMKTVLILFSSMEKEKAQEKEKSFPGNNVKQSRIEDHPRKR